MSASPSHPPAEVSGTQACPECRREIAAGMLEMHLRQVHCVYQFRGKRYAEHELIPLLLAFAVNPHPGRDAWEQLLAVVSEWIGVQAPEFLVQRLTAALCNTDVGWLERTIAACAEMAAPMPLADTLIAGLGRRREVIARALALAIAGRMPAPVEANVFELVGPLLCDHELSVESQVSAVRSLLDSTLGRPELAAKLVKSFIARMGKPRALARLELLQESVGPLPLVLKLRSRLERHVHLRCPRCTVELRRKEMKLHLWGEHGLVLDGKRAREPWRIIEDWVEEHKKHEDAELLRRCRALAQRVDPQHGRRRFYRLLLAGDVDDAHARHILLAQAQRKAVSLCPYCFEFVPMPDEISVPVINTWRGRVSALGYKVEVRDRGIFSRLEISTPRRVLFSGPEPGRTFTSKAWLLVVGGIPVYAALLMSALPVTGWIPLLPIALLLVVAWIMYLALYRRRQSSALYRGLSHAWSELAPYLLEGRESTDGCRFTSGLAALSERLGWYQVPADLSRQARQQAEKLVESGAGASAVLAAWDRLTLAQAAVARRDVVSLVVEQIMHCFKGDLPARYAHHLLQGARWLNRHRGDPARLRVLLCAAAFQAGLETRNILEACQMAPALEDALRAHDLKYLAMARLLWSMRSTRPWNRCGPARTLFEIAQGDAGVLIEIPDLLLLDEDADVKIMEVGTGQLHPARIAVCSGGVRVGNVLLSTAPEKISIDPTVQGDLCDLTVDAHVFRLSGDAKEWGARLRAWVAFYFEELRPQSGEVLRWHPGDRVAPLHYQQLRECPGCHRKVFPRQGEVAGSLEVGRLIGQA